MSVPWKNVIKALCKISDQGLEDSCISPRAICICSPNWYTVLNTYIRKHFKLHLNKIGEHFRQFVICNFSGWATGVWWVFEDCEWGRDACEAFCNLLARTPTTRISRDWKRRPFYTVVMDVLFVFLCLVLWICDIFDLP